MNILERMRGWLGGGLRRYELVAVDALAETIGEEARRRMGLQLRCISRVVRAANDKEISLYTSSLPDGASFLLDTPQALLATVWIHAGDTEVRAEFWTVSGVLFSIRFSTAPDAWADRNVHVRNSVVWENPMEPPPNTDPIRTEQLKQWLEGLPCSANDLCSARGPLPQSVIERRLKALSCAVPHDWLSFVKLCDGLTCAGVSLHGVSDARVVTLPEADLLLVAESRGPDVLVLDRAATDGRLYFENLEDESRTDAGLSFHAAVGVLARRG